VLPIRIGPFTYWPARTAAIGLIGTTAPSPMGPEPPAPMGASWVTTVCQMVSALLLRT